MTQINLLPVKEWLFKNWAIVALVIVSFLYFKSCEGSRELESSLSASKVKEDSYKAIAKTNEDAAVFYRTQANKRKTKIAVLEKEVVALKTSKIAVDKKTAENIKKVQSFTSQEIKKYYVNEFKYLDIPIVAAGLVHSDSLNKMIITVIEKGKGSEEKLVLTEKALAKSEVANAELKQANGELEKSNDSFSEANDNLKKANEEADKAVKIVEKSFRKERNKKTFWQATTAAVIIGASYLLIVK